MIIAVTGHRPDKLGGYDKNAPLNIKVRGALISFLAARQAKYGDDLTVISGMALGVDQWFARAAMEMYIPFIAAVPFEGQEARWNWVDQKNYAQLLDAAKEVVIVSPGGYTAQKMHVRNRWMVDHSDGLLAVYDGSEDGGTANCVNYARLAKVNKPIIVINPKEL